MKRKLNTLNVIRELKKKEIKIFSPLEFKRIFDVSDYAVRWFLKDHTKKGLFIKLKNGLYILKDNSPSTYSIANRLYQPSYISFDIALSHYGIIPETIYTITSATTKTTRSFETDGIRYEYRKIKKEAYTGYGAIEYFNETVLMAEPEKALADFLYFVALKKRSLEYERLDFENIEKSKLLSYAKLFKKPEIIQLIKKLYVEQGKPTKIY